MEEKLTPKEREMLFELVISLNRSGTGYPENRVGMALRQLRQIKIECGLDKIED